MRGWNLIDVQKGQMDSLDTLELKLDLNQRFKEKDIVRFAWETHVGFNIPKINEELKLCEYLSKEIGCTVVLEPIFCDSRERSDRDYTPLKINGVSIKHLWDSKISRNTYMSEIKIDTEIKQRILTKIEEKNRDLVPIFGDNSHNIQSLADLQSEIYWAVMNKDYNEFQKNTKKSSIILKKYLFSPHDCKSDIIKRNWDHMQLCHQGQDGVFLQLIKNKSHVEYVIDKYRNVLMENIENSSEKLFPRILIAKEK